MFEIFIPDTHGPCKLSFFQLFEDIMNILDPEMNLIDELIFINGSNQQIIAEFIVILPFYRAL